VRPPRLTDGHHSGRFRVRESHLPRFTASLIFSMINRPSGKSWGELLVIHRSEMASGFDLSESAPVLFSGTRSLSYAVQYTKERGTGVLRLFDWNFRREYALG
jgi:hypothetical protein